MIKTKYIHYDWRSDVDFISGRFFLHKSSDIEFKRISRFFFHNALKHYKCYLLNFISHDETSRIDKRKNEIKLANLADNNEVVYLDMNGGNFACFEVGIGSFDRVHGKQRYFAFSKNPNFMGSIAESLSSYPYDDFIEFLHFLKYCDKNSLFLNKFNANPIIKKVCEGDLFLNTSFSDLYPDEKFFGLCYKKDISCPILKKMILESCDGRKNERS